MAIEHTSKILRILCLALPMAFVAFSANAETIRRSIGLALQQAEALAAGGEYDRAMAKVVEAEALPDQTPSEIKTIGQVRNYITAKAAGLTATAHTTPAAVTGRLTDKAAQRLVESFFGRGMFSSILVDGVIENAQDNTAMADLYLTNLIWQARKNDAVTAYVMGPGGGSRTYTGKATAVFAHYNDGRWVLVRVQTPMGNFEAN